MKVHVNIRTLTALLVLGAVAFLPSTGQAAWIKYIYIDFDNVDEAVAGETNIGAGVGSIGDPDVPWATSPTSATSDTFTITMDSNDTDEDGGGPDQSHEIEFKDYTRTGGAPAPFTTTMLSGQIQGDGDATELYLDVTGLEAGSYWWYVAGGADGALGALPSTFTIADAAGVTIDDYGTDATHEYYDDFTFTVDTGETHGAIRLTAAVPIGETKERAYSSFVVYQWSESGIIPEPSTFVLASIALLGLVLAGWRRRNARG